MYSRTKTSSLIKDLPDQNFKVMIEPVRKSRKPQKEKFVDMANKIQQF